MAVTFLELYGDRLDRELGSADRDKLFTTARRQAAIREAERWFINETACLVKTAEITLIDGTSEYDLEAEIDDELYLRLDADGPEIHADPGSGGTILYYAGDQFRRRTIPYLNKYEPGWRGLTKGTPYCWYDTTEGGTDIFGVVPAPGIPAGATWTLRVPYVILADTLTDDADEPFTVDGDPKRTLQTWAAGLVYYAASELEKLRKNTDRSLVLKTLAEQQVLDYVASQPSPGGQTVNVQRSYRREGRSRRGLSVAWGLSDDR